MLEKHLEKMLPGTALLGGLDSWRVGHALPCHTMRPPLPAGSVAQEIVYIGLEVGGPSVPEAVSITGNLEEDTAH